ncbi:hypothetical protein Sjap_013348 [Stephania japonica]|uniref:Uncharacterized protein n=1 Tax=Stephania japonica TaxID=461633 RepID=A0AAP0P179_9MAGN
MRNETNSSQPSVVKYVIGLCFLIAFQVSQLKMVGMSSGWISAAFGPFWGFQQMGFGNGSVESWIMHGSLFPRHT